jgi:hypothetical protein
VENYLKDHSLIDLFDGVLIPALALSEADRHRGILSDEQLDLLHVTTRHLVDDVVDDEQHAIASPNPDTHPVCVTVPARDEADELSAVMAAHVLRIAGVHAEIIPLGTRSELLQSLKNQSPEALLISAVPPFCCYASAVLMPEAASYVP